MTWSYCICDSSISFSSHIPWSSRRNDTSYLYHQHTHHSLTGDLCALLQLCESPRFISSGYETQCLQLPARNIRDPPTPPFRVPERVVYEWSQFTRCNWVNSRNQTSITFDLGTSCPLFNSSTLFSSSSQVSNPKFNTYSRENSTISNCGYYRKPQHPQQSSEDNRHQTT